MVKKMKKAKKAKKVVRKAKKSKKTKKARKQFKRQFCKQKIIRQLAYYFLLTKLSQKKEKKFKLCQNTFRAYS